MSIVGINIPNLGKTVITNNITSNSGAAAGFPFSSSPMIISGEGSNVATQYSTSSGNVVVLGRKMASIFTSGVVTSTAFASANQFVVVSGFSQTGAIMRGFTMSSSGALQYTGADPFYGAAMAIASIESSNVNALGVLALGKNGVIQPSPGSRTGLTTNNTFFSAGLFQTVSLNTNDIIDLRIANTVNGTSITVDSYNFLIQ